MRQIVINWDTLSYRPGDTLKASIYAADDDGIPARSINWQLIRNNGVLTASGNGKSVAVANASGGLYRLVAQVLDGRGVTSTTSSTVLVSDGFEASTSLEPDPVVGSLVYLGSLYTGESRGSSGTATSTPYLLSGQSEVLYLFPGTTHVTFELDPTQSSVDDEVVVRTRLGNWALRGGPSGLNGQDIGYGYRIDNPAIPAPADLKLQIGLEAFKVNGLSYASSNFRVKVNCWYNTAAIYRYDRCAYGIHPGGEGRRMRRFAALFTALTVEPDRDTSLNRLESLSHSGPVLYTCTEAQSIPAMALAATGSPYPVNRALGLTFTDANRYAIYESDSAREIDAKAVAALEGIRPFYLSLQLPAYPIVAQRIKRLHGNLVVYVNNGPLYAGSVVRADVVVNGTVSTYTIPITETVYPADETVYARAGAIPIDLSDYQFSHNGVVVHFSVDETGVASGTITPSQTTPVLGEAAIYSTAWANSVTFDGACYTNPTFVYKVMTEGVAFVVNNSGCYNSACGPSGLYCYTSVQDPARQVQLPQPLYAPAPFVSYGTDPAYCYAGPTLLSAISGTGYDLMDVRSFQISDYCGKLAQYSPCQTGNDLIVVYPHASSPHSFVSYGGACYGFNGTVLTVGTTSLTFYGSVTPVASCVDSACTGSNPSGDSYLYSANETGSHVSIKFESLDLGIPHFGVSAQVIDTGVGSLSSGRMSARFLDNATRAVLLRAADSGRLAFVVKGLRCLKQLIVVRGVTEIHYALGPAEDAKIVDVQTGDQVYLDVSAATGRINTFAKGVVAGVLWSPVVAVPRVYHTATLNFTGSSPIVALGFCGLDSHQLYQTFGTLPADVSSTDIVNPDTYVTAQGSNGTESLVIRNRSQGDVVPYTAGLPWYSGDSLSSPVTFRFYAGREAQGAHGEMDVWLNTDGTFPAAFKVDDYRALVSMGSSYRKTAELTDTHRNSVQVTATPGDYYLPHVYLASDGQALSLKAQAGTVAISAKSFIRQGADNGLAFSIQTV